VRPYPPVYAAGAAALMVGLDRWAPLAQLWEAWNWLALVPAATGFGLAIWAAVTFRRHHTTAHPFRKADALVISGPFAISRNPIYLGMALVLLGLAIGLGTAAPFLVVPVFMALIGRLIIGDEEAMLTETFGAEYDAYTKRVRRWF